MSIATIAIYFVAFLILGGILGWAAFRVQRRQTIAKAQDEAQSLLQEYRDEAEMRELERQERVQEIEQEAWGRVENDLLKSEERIEILQEKVDERKQATDTAYSQERQKLVEHDRQVKSKEDSLRAKEKNFEQKKSGMREFRNKFVETLHAKLGTNSQAIISEIGQQLEKEAREWTRRWVDETEEDFKAHAENKAKQIMDTIIGRFARPYCAERGLGAVNFPDANARKNLLGPNGTNLKLIQELCGCDLIVEEDSEVVGIAGFDPVRRELTRRTVERLLKEKKTLTPESITRIAELQKKELFRQIKNDGDAVARELGLSQLHPEVRQMMGSLRYRYSFTQNQYFHCAEVGWLAGLLASEVRANIKSSRRAGLLHDIGKSMDHAMEGGHAIIGANFIAARGEDAETVHAVRAHHFDEQPATDTAFLVIAADAISGARPGARRSTIESYNQKVSELQDIARSFPGVTDGFVLSGGRELRVFVNSKKVDDNHALDLSRKIAKRIEDECNYPGHIKVVVVRETLVTESTQSYKNH